jgi:hypothetical protein
MWPPVPEETPAPAPAPSHPETDRRPAAGAAFWPELLRPRVGLGSRDGATADAAPRPAPHLDLPAAMERIANPPPAPPIPARADDLWPDLPPEPPPEPDEAFVFLREQDHLRRLVREQEAAPWSA